MFRKDDSPATVRQIATELYETEYRIYDFTKGKAGMMASAVQPKEEYYKNTILDNRLREYLEKGIKDLTGINFIEYMSLPRELITQIGRIVDEFNRMKLRIQENAEEEARRKEREAEEKRKRESRRIVSVNGNVIN